MTAPRIAVSGVLRRWQDADRVAVNAAYVHSLVAAGAVPLMLSQLIGPDAADRALEACDGLLLTGGEDIDPACYGGGPERPLRTVDQARDAFELALFRAARQQGLPILGICRGMQLINVALGGTLWQDLPSDRGGAVDHDPATARDARVHLVRLTPGSRAARALGSTQLSPNSFHHQGIRDLAPGLVATAWAPDGLIEAVETAEEDGWLLGIQWHPEEMHADRSAPEGGLFAALVAAATAPGRRPARSQN